MRAAAAQIEIQMGSGWRYEGQKRGGNWHGLGVYSRFDGSRYEGMYRDNKCNGHGTCTYADGRVESGQWKNMKFLGQARKQAGSAAASFLKHHSFSLQLD